MNSWMAPSIPGSIIPVPIYEKMRPRKIEVLAEATQLEDIRNVI